MMRTYMKRLAFLMLVACGSPSALPDGSAMLDGPPGQGPRDGEAGLYCPAGTTLTPYKGEVRKTSFAMADMVLDSSADCMNTVNICQKPC